MKHLKNFKQYERMSYSNYDSINEGSIWDKIRSNTGKIKNFITQKLSSMAPEKVQQLKSEMAKYRGKSFQEIQTEVKSASGKLTEQSEPSSDNYGRLSPDSYRGSEWTLSRLINVVLGAGMAGGFVILIMQSLISGIVGTQVLTDKFMGYSVLVMILSAIIWVFKNALFSDD